MLDVEFFYFRGSGNDLIHCSEHMTSLIPIHMGACNMHIGALGASFVDS